MSTTSKETTLVFETIKRRRSIGKMTEQCPSREQIERILEAATHAPNHHRVEPWRFFVLAGNTRHELGEIMADSLAQKMEEIASGKAQAILTKELHKPLRSPVIIVVAAEHPTQANVLEIEDVTATAAAVQNMLLTAEELGLAAMWRTGDAAYNPRVKQWLGLATEDHIIAFVYLGFPAIAHTERHNIPAVNKTVWMGWEA